MKILKTELNKRIKINIIIIKNLGSISNFENSDLNNTKSFNESESLRIFIKGRINPTFTDSKKAFSNEREKKKVILFFLFVIAHNLGNRCRFFIQIIVRLLNTKKGFENLFFL